MPFLAKNYPIRKFRMIARSGRYGFCQDITVNVPSLLAHVDGEIDGQERRRRDRAGALLRSGRTSSVDLPHLCTFRKLLR